MGSPPCTIESVVMLASGSLVPAAVPVPRRPARSRVRHGQASCADYGCIQAVCRQAKRWARYERERDHAAGLAARVDSTEASDHAVMLRSNNMSAQNIADASGISVTLIRRLLRPMGERPDRISRYTADAVLGVSLSSHSARRDEDGRGLTDATCAADLLTTLAAAGWSATYLATRLGISARTITAIRSRKRRRIRIVVDQGIRDLYPRLAGADGGL